MDDKLFKQLLSEVAEWRIPEAVTGSKDGVKRSRGRPSKELQYQLDRERIFQEEFDGVNPTFPPQVIKLKNSACVCEDCGQHCENGRQMEKKLYETSGKKNWRERCLTCERSKNPFTGKYDLTFSQAPHIWTDFLKDRKMVYKTEKNQARKPAQIESKTIIENHREKITYYTGDKEVE